MNSSLSWRIYLWLKPDFYVLGRNILDFNSNIDRINSIRGIVTRHNIPIPTTQIRSIFQCNPPSRTSKFSLIPSECPARQSFRSDEKHPLLPPKRSRIIHLPISQLKTTAQMSTISSEEATLRKKYKPKEIKFETPYGHIACLEWGKRDSPNKILCVHGWLDNAGSFERLIPFILDHSDNIEQYHIVAMDMPGVGHSSHKPPGSDYTAFDNVLEMRRITQQLGWTKVTLLAHSLGSHFSFLYSCVYPNQVESVISIDLAQPITRQVLNWNVTIADSIEEQFKCEYHSREDPTTNIRIPVYSEGDAIKRLMDAHSSSLSQESAAILLKRGATKQRWGYTFNRDVRLRFLSLEIRPDDNFMLQLLEGPFRPNLFIIRATRSPYHRPEDMRLNYYALFKRNCPIFRDVKLEGTHHLHMNDPDIVSVEINKFLDEVRSARSSKESIIGTSINKSNL